MHNCLSFSSKKFGNADLNNDAVSPIPFSVSMRKMYNSFNLNFDVTGLRDRESACQNLAGIYPKKGPSFVSKGPIS
jgi:hypothetical protein